MEYSELFVLVFILILGTFVFSLSAVLIYVYCNSNRDYHDEERQELLSEQPIGKFITQESSFIDIKLVDKVKIKRERVLNETRESAFLYLKFFMRSNSTYKFRTVEHLPIIGKNSMRNWFLLENELGKKMSFIDCTGTEKKGHDFSHIFKSMEITSSEFNYLINGILTSIKHTNLLPFYSIHIEDAKVLVLQDYSKEGINILKGFL